MNKDQFLRFSALIFIWTVTWLPFAIVYYCTKPFVFIHDWATENANKSDERIAKKHNVFEFMTYIADRRSKR